MNAGGTDVQPEPVRDGRVGVAFDEEGGDGVLAGVTPLRDGRCTALGCMGVARLQRRSKTVTR